MRGDAEVVLEPWPEVELVFRGLPALPEGFALVASLRGPAVPPTRNYWLPGKGADWLLDASGGNRDVVSGRVALPIGDGAHKLLLWVRAGKGRTSFLRQESPADIYAGPGAIEVRVAAEKVAQAVAELQQAEAERRR